MKKLILIMAMALLLAGCVIDDSMTKPYVPDPNFDFNAEEVYIQVRTKSINDYYVSRIYAIYASSEQAAYLMSGTEIFDFKLNGKRIKRVEFTINGITEVHGDTIYELSPTFISDTINGEEYGKAITSFSVSYKDKELIHFEHSPILVNNDQYKFALVGGYKENENDKSGLGLTNNTSDTYLIEHLFVEDIFGNRYTIQQKEIEYKSLQTIKLPLTKELLKQQNLQGVLGIYAKLASGEEKFLVEAPFTIDGYEEQQLELFKQRIEQKKSSQ